MECKWVRLIKRMVSKHELIDTLWNVNVTRDNALNTVLNELIDTLWNVNLLKSFESYLATVN